ncbi:hypothetical protein ACFX2A_000432 [Malus domestica]
MAQPTCCLRLIKVADVAQDLWHGYRRRGRPTEAATTNAECMQQWKLRDELVEQAETDAEQGLQGGELRGPEAVKVQMIPLNSFHLHAHFPHM